MQRKLVAGLAVTAAFMQITGAVAADWKSNLEDALKSQYVLTTRSKLGRILEPGTVLVIQQEGIKADKPKAMMRPTVIESGSISKTGGGLLFSGGRALPKGDRVHLYDLRVKDKGVDLIIGTVKTYDVSKRGTTESTPYEAALHFAFEPSWLETASPEDVLAEIEPWLLNETQAAAAEVKTIQLGQTKDVVVKILGQPGKIIDLGAKVIYVYPDLKITFREGKVSDVE